MTKEDVIKFLEDSLKDEEGKVGIKMTTDGDTSINVGLYSDIVYDYSQPTFSDPNVCGTCLGDTRPVSFIYINETYVPIIRNRFENPVFYRNRDEKKYSTDDIERHEIIQVRELPLEERETWALTDDGICEDCNGSGLKKEEYWEYPDASDAVVINKITKSDAIKIIKAMLK